MIKNRIFITFWKIKFVGFSGGEIKKEIAEKLGTPIVELCLSNRALNCLKRADIEYAEQLVKMEIEQLFRLRNFGIVTLHEIKEKLKAFGFDYWN